MVVVVDVAVVDVVVVDVAVVIDVDAVAACCCVIKLFSSWVSIMRQKKGK